MLETLEALRGLLGTVNDRNRQQLLSTSGVLVSACDEPGQCPICRGPWHVQKTAYHHAKTIRHGQFEIRETIHVCADRCRDESGRLIIRRAHCLAKHIVPGRTVGYDVMVYVGLERFLHHRQREEIRTSLRHEHGIDLSTGTISNLAKGFLGYMQALHNKHIGRLQNVLAGDGGWPLHIDATGEDGRGTLLVALAGWRKWVLGSWKIPTECTQAILPRLHEVVGQFGLPCAVMRDLGRAITPAVNHLLAELKLDIPVLACHLHFLKDIGKDLLNPAYGELRALFRRYKIRPKLCALSRDLGRKLGNQIGEARSEVEIWQAQIETDHTIPSGRAGMAVIRSLTQWVIDYKADSTGCDYPFDRPYLDLYDRCTTAQRAIDAFMRKTPTDRKVLNKLKRLQRLLDPVTSDVPFKQIARRLRTRAGLFDELRDALRLEPNALSSHTKRKAEKAPTLDQAATELRNIQEQVEELVASLKNRRPQRGPAQDARSAIDLILRHIEAHGDYLWGHVIRLPKQMGGGIRLVERTNNILEGFFHGMKHDERRRSGRKILTQDFEHLPPEAALVYNLKCPDYVSIVCGSLNRLEEAFAKIDLSKEEIMNDSKERTNGDINCTIPHVETASLPTVDRRLIRRDQMQRRIYAAAKSRAPHFRS